MPRIGPWALWALLPTAAPGQQATGGAPALAPDRADAWGQELTLPDLDRREASYERLVEEAFSDASLRAWLEAVACDAGELAWTARLALRELGGTDGLPSATFEARLREVAIGRPGPLDVLLLPSPQPRSPRATDEPRERERRRQVRVRSLPQGLEIRVETHEGGVREVREYQGGSLAEVLRAHPELSQELGLRETLRWRIVAARSVGAEPQPAVRRTDILGVVVELLSAEEAQERGLDSGRGLKIARVVPGTLARAMGLAPGDVLWTLGGRALALPDDVTAGFRELERTGELPVEWFDAGGRRRERTWTALEPRPVPDEPDAAARAPSDR